MREVLGFYNLEGMHNRPNHPSSSRRPAEAGRPMGFFSKKVHDSIFLLIKSTFKMVELMFVFSILKGQIANDLAFCPLVYRLLFRFRKNVKAGRNHSHHDFVFQVFIDD